MERGFFITLEGGEGGGKSTLAHTLAVAMREKGISVITTREPGGSPGAELIRDLLVKGKEDSWDGITEYLLLSAGRRDHIIKTIQPALAAGTWVICDRFFDSSLAYQGGGYGLDKTILQTLFDWIAEGLSPDKTFLLDLEPTLGLERTYQRLTEEVRYEGLPKAFHQRVRETFLELARTYPARFTILDATLSPQKLLEQALEDLTSWIKEWKA